MRIEEAEDLGLRVAEGVKHRAGLQVGLLGQVDHHLHAHRPFAMMVAGRQSEVLVQLAAHRSHRPVAHHGQRRVNIHARHEAGFRPAIPVHALIAQAHAADLARLR